MFRPRGLAPDPTRALPWTHSLLKKAGENFYGRFITRLLLVENMAKPYFRRGFLWFVFGGLIWRK